MYRSLYICSKSPFTTITQSAEFTWSAARFLHFPQILSGYPTIYLSFCVICRLQPLFCSKSLRQHMKFLSILRTKPKMNACRPLKNRASVLPCFNEGWCSCERLNARHFDISVVFSCCLHFSSLLLYFSLHPMRSCSTPKLFTIYRVAYTNILVSVFVSHSSVYLLLPAL